jgi:hypothetical protein
VGAEQERARVAPSTIHGGEQVWEREHAAENAEHRADDADDLRALSPEDPDGEDE